MSKSYVKFVEVSAPRFTYLMLAVFLLSMAWRSHSDTTIALVTASVSMFAVCWSSATRLFGTRAAFRFVLIAVSVGWFAEQMGASRGWFFGSYTYTNVLGYRLGKVPAVIPLMWFALCYVGVVLANLIALHRPARKSSSLSEAVFLSFLAAALVTAYDLAADPYMVYVLRAWIMTETDGLWFGETLQGFAGWMTVSFAIVMGFRWATQSLPSPSKSTIKVGDALVPVSIYGGSMVFQMMEGHPVETRTIAAFAMGIPLSSAIFGLVRWQQARVSARPRSKVSEARLSALSFRADPLADNTVSSILAPHALASGQGARAEAFKEIALMNRQLATWDNNQALLGWPNEPTGLSDETVAQVRKYLSVGHELPSWADSKKLERAEVLFWDYGALSCTILFCSSLPECYVLPKLSEVLHVAGQLEEHTEHRVRSTAAMIFPVMMHGGLRDPKGSGVAQILKVRLIHATIRHLILRNSPTQALAELDDNNGERRVEPNEISGDAHLHESLFARGWDMGALGVPCNQEELAYTLLTFSYVFLRSLRKLGLGLAPDDEIAVLHTWNVVGHVLGIRRELMANTMEEAEALFGQMQAPHRLEHQGPDPRPNLGRALMRAMEASIPLRILKPFPALMTRYLCGAEQARMIGVEDRVSLVAHATFFAFLALTRAIDSAVRFVLPEFSITRMLTRVLGYHFMTHILLDETRPLKLPSRLLGQINQTVTSWKRDPKAPAWLDSLERRFTTHAVRLPTPGHSEGERS